MIIIYILLLAVMFVSSYYLKKTKHIDYTDIKLSNYYLYGELILFFFATLLLGLSYFCFSIYLLLVLYFYILYLKSNIKSNNDEKEKIKETIEFFTKKFIILLLLSIPIYFIVKLKIILFIILSFVIELIIVTVDTISEMNYKLMKPEEIQLLFPNYDINNLYISLFNTLVFIKNNYSTSNVDKIESYLDINLYQIYKTKESENIAKKQKEVYSDFKYISCNLIKYDIKNKIFKAELIYNCKNYTIDIDSGRVLNGTPMYIKTHKCVFEFLYTDRVIIRKESLIEVK